MLTDLTMKTILDDICISVWNTDIRLKYSVGPNTNSGEREEARIPQDKDRNESTASVSRSP